MSAPDKASPSSPSAPPADWVPDSWRARPVRQQPPWPDPAAVRTALGQVAALPPLVSAGQVDKLRQRLAAAGRGEAFVLQGGDCAERFQDCRADHIANLLRILLQMSVILTYGVRRPVVRIGRMAGQYAKPRSQDFEPLPGGGRVACYRGDAVNGIVPDAASRTPAPGRLVEAYFHAAATLNHIRALIDGGFADLRHPHLWDIDAMRNSPHWTDYRDILDRILDAIDYFDSLGSVQSETLGRVDFFTSHEALLLDWEESLTRRDAATGRWYNLGAHMVWVGARTRALDEAHVEYARGLANPVGVKIDPSCAPDEAVALVERLNPADEPGRLALITRLGARRVEELLPPLVRAVGRTGRHVVWICDPMHGNTETTDEGRKTRVFDTILDELTRTFHVLQREGAHLGGVHFELTADDVTECVGGAEELTGADLARNYDTWCDPRLNNAQSLEVAFLLARLLKQPSNRMA